MAERFDDVCEPGELSGGDDLGGPSQKRAKYTGYKYKTKDWESKWPSIPHKPPLLSTIILMKMDFNSTPPGFHYEFKGFFHWPQYFLPNYVGWQACY